MVITITVLPPLLFLSTLLGTFSVALLAFLAGSYHNAGNKGPFRVCMALAIFMIVFLVGEMALIMPLLST